MDISIVIPAYNAAGHIEACLESICRQDVHPNVLEVVVVNDGSTDETRQRVEAFAKNHSDIRWNIVHLQQNQGRFQARLAGIKAAVHSHILFLDTRVELARNALQSVARINYQPLMGTHQHIPINNMFDHFFLMVRRRRYFSTFPKMPETFIYINDANFHRCPKGTCDFLCAKDLLLATLPLNVSKDSSDDTAWIRNIAARSRIMIHNDFEVIYHSRNQISEILRHLFERGPKFMDYYYRPTERFFWLFNAAAMFLAVGAFLVSGWYLALLLVLALMLNLCISVYLADSVKGFFVAFFTLPLAAGAFSLGLIKGLGIKLRLLQTV